MNLRKILFAHWPLILYLVACVITVLPFFANGFFAFHDDVQVSRVFEMTKSLSAGMVPVRWVADLGYGYGYPIFNFYSVLPYYIGGGLSFMGVDALISTKIVFVLAIILSGVSMYFLVRSFFGKAPALVSAIIYLYFPYHAVNIYVRGDLAELSAYVFLPLVFLSLFKIHTENKISKLYIVVGILSVTAVVISHNLSAFMLFIFAGIFIVYSLISGKDKKKLATSYFLVFVVAFLLSAFYALPAIVESKYSNVLTQVGGGADWHNNFICPVQLWDSPWGFGGSTKGCADGLSFRLGKSNIIFVVISIAALFISFKFLKEKRTIVVSCVVFMLVAIFMTLSYSSFLWSLPYMDFLQYPWRFLNFVSLFASLLIGFLVWFVSEKFKERLGILTAVIIVAATLLLNAKLFVPQQMLNRTAAYYTNRSYLSWTASKISDEYLPKGFREPKSPGDVIASMKALPERTGDLYIKSYLPDKTFKFSFSQTPLEVGSDALSILGVLALALVIIRGFSKTNGKKAS